jgi:hypothetical protein
MIYANQGLSCMVKTFFKKVQVTSRFAQLRVIFCLACKPLAGRTRRLSRKKRFCYLLPLWAKGRQGIVKQFRAANTRNFV